MVSRCFPGGYNVKLYISRGRLAWWLLAFLHGDSQGTDISRESKGFCLSKIVITCKEFVARVKT